MRASRSNAWRRGNGGPGQVGARLYLARLTIDVCPRASKRHAFAENQFHDGLLSPRGEPGAVAGVEFPLRPEVEVHDVEQLILAARQRVEARHATEATVVLEADVHLR